jgi:hypothetical protein
MDYFYFTSLHILHLFYFFILSYYYYYYYFFFFILLGPQAEYNKQMILWVAIQKGSSRRHHMSLFSRDQNPGELKTDPIAPE